MISPVSGLIVDLPYVFITDWLKSCSRCTRPSKNVLAWLCLSSSCNRINEISPNSAIRACVSFWIVFKVCYSSSVKNLFSVTVSIIVFVYKYYAICVKVAITDGIAGRVGIDDEFAACNWPVAALQLHFISI